MIVHFSRLCCVLHTCQVIFFFVAVLILRSLLEVSFMWTVFRIHKPVIWSLLNILVVCDIVQSVCLWSALSHAMLCTKCHLWLLMYALLQCNVPRIFTLHICKTDMVLQMKVAEYRVGRVGFIMAPSLLNFMGDLLKLEILSWKAVAALIQLCVCVCVSIYIYIYIYCLCYSLQYFLWCGNNVLC